MISNNENRAVLALQELMNVARLSRNQGDAWLYALTWLAACRLTPLDSNGGASGINGLLLRKTWDHHIYSAIPDEAKELVWGLQADSPSGLTARTQALSIVTGLIEQGDSQDWNVIDAPWQLAGSMRTDFFGELVLAPELCELLFAGINAQSGDSVWIPFDLSGQLVVRAVRKGLKVIAAGPLGRSQLHLKLLLAIEKVGMSNEASVVFDVPRAGANRDLHCDFLIATPPINMRIQPGTGWRQWEGINLEQVSGGGLYSRQGPFAQVQLDRSDSWAVAAFWPRISKRAVFLVSPNVLFAKGQEQRLRENLLLNEGALSAVTMLPTRQMSVTSMASALLILDRKNFKREVRFTDAEVVSLMMGEKEDLKISITVEVEEIAKQDFNLVPARYLRQSLTGPRRSLGELVQVIRAPVASKDPAALSVQEAGFPELDGWREVSGPFSKTTSINGRKLEDSMLMQGDVLLSIKGTLGKSALIGRVPTVDPSVRHAVMKQHIDSISTDAVQSPVVPSQSCIALRVVNKDISPIHLLMYLRSDDFKSQLESLRVGAVVAHVTPATLMQEIKVPIPKASELGGYQKKYDELCDLEASIGIADQRMSDIRSELWPTHADVGAN